jgi:hypothetical protein
MKFFEIHDPYYALIKAPNEAEAIQEYVKSVADDDELNPLKDEIGEVDRDYAVASYSRAKSEDNEDVPLSEILEDIRNERTMILIIDGSLI